MFGVFGMTKNITSRIKSTMTTISPNSIPSMTSFVSMVLMYNIPKNPVTIMVMIGITMFMWGILSVNNGLNIDDRP